jgi:hypothetical protein
VSANHPFPRSVPQIWQLPILTSLGQKADAFTRDTAPYLSFIQMFSVFGAKREPVRTETATQAAWPGSLGRTHVEDETSCASCALLYKNISTDIIRSSIPLAELPRTILNQATPGSSSKVGNRSQGGKYIRTPVPAISLLGVNPQHLNRHILIRDVALMLTAASYPSDSESAKVRRRTVKGYTGLSRESRHRKETGPGARLTLSTPNHPWYHIQPSPSVHIPHPTHDAEPWSSVALSKKRGTQRVRNVEVT